MLLDSQKHLGKSSSFPAPALLPQHNVDSLGHCVHFATAKITTEGCEQVLFASCSSNREPSADTLFYAYYEVEHRSKHQVYRHKTVLKAPYPLPSERQTTASGVPGS